MKQKITGLIVVLLFSFCIVVAQQTTADFQNLTGSYLGQQPPGKIPELFAPDVFSAQFISHHSALHFSPDGKELYFHAREKDTGRALIWFSRIEGTVWSSPKPVSWGLGSDDAPFMTHDGERMFFLSWCAADKKGRADKETVWVMNKTEKGWGQPELLPQTINSMRLIHWGISLDRNQNLYFGVRPTMSLSDGYAGDIYCAGFKNGTYVAPIKLPLEINIPGFKFSPFIAPDGSYILFTHIGNKDDHYKIMISFNTSNGVWTKAKEINDSIGLKNENIMNPYVSPDGKYFFFNRIVDNSGKYYWIDASFIEEMRRKNK